MKKLLGIIFLIFLITQVTLPGLMGYKMMIAALFLLLEMFFNIFGTKVKEGNTVNPSELKF
jgi:hypothetical protein